MELGEWNYAKQNESKEFNLYVEYRETNKKQTKRTLEFLQQKWYYHTKQRLGAKISEASVNQRKLLVLWWQLWQDNIHLKKCESKAYDLKPM